MEKQISEEARLNKFAMIGWTITAVIIAGAYLLEVLKGERSILYYLALVVIGVGPVIVSWMIYGKDAESKLIRSIVAYSYSVLYAFVLLTGDTILTFVYLFPILMVLIVYSDRVILRNYAIIGVLANIVSVAKKALFDGMVSADNIADYEIEVFAVLLVMVLGYLSCRIMSELNEKKLEMIAQQNTKQEEVLAQVLQAAEILNERVGHIDQKAKDIEQRSESAQLSIEEIATGTADVANNIQEQLGMSTGISDELENLTEISREIQNKFTETHQMSQAGIKSVDNLSQSAEMVAKSKEKVSGATESLISSLQEAKEILSLIRSITDQTNLLALNASIEAARAGEQGKGFAVVAGEIQKLSGDTGSATDKISDILETLATEASHVNDAVGNLDEVSNRQNQLIQETDEQFRVIDTNIAEMTDGVKRQGAFLSQINDNNVKIAGSISNTSAYTQQLTASSENTMNMTRESLEGTKDMAEALNQILAQIQNLQAITESKE